MVLVKKFKQSSKELEGETAGELAEQILLLEQQQENLENIKSIIDFLKKEE